MADFEFQNQKLIFPTSIETDRLHLIPIFPENLSIKAAYDVFSSLSEKETQFVSLNAHKNISETFEWITSAKESFENGELAQYYIYLKNQKTENPLIGTTSFEPKWDAGIAESGIFLFEKYWGNGYSSERGETMLELAFKIYDFDFYLSRCSNNNQNSKSAIEKYLLSNGGQLVGDLPPENPHSYDSDEITLYKITKENYLRD